MNLRSRPDRSISGKNMRKLQVKIEKFKLLFIPSSFQGNSDLCKQYPNLLTLFSVRKNELRSHRNISLKKIPVVNRTFGIDERYSFFLLIVWRDSVIFHNRLTKF